MNRFLAAASALTVLAIASQASAADLAARTAPVYTKAPEYASPVSNWSGWYIGGNVGGAWGGKTGNVTDFNDALVNAISAGAIPSALGASHDGGFGGGQFGYNWVMSNWLVGFEADIQGVDIGKTNTIIPFAPGFDPNVTTARDHIDWFGTARGRLGVTTGSVLLYGTAGLAFGGVKSSVTSVFQPAVDGNDTGSSSSTRFGWAAGAGFEWMFVPNWSLKGEYLHVDLGSSTVTISDPVNFPGSFADYNFHHAFDSARVGVNYHFH
jgi:outer membrane immunogenic protein